MCEPSESKSEGQNNQSIGKKKQINEDVSEFPGAGEKRKISKQVSESESKVAKFSKDPLSNVKDDALQKNDFSTHSIKEVESEEDNLVFESDKEKILNRKNDKKGDSLLDLTESLPSTLTTRKTQGKNFMHENSIVINKLYHFRSS